MFWCLSQIICIVYLFQCVGKATKAEINCPWYNWMLFIEHELYKYRIRENNFGSSRSSNVFVGL